MFCQKKWIFIIAFVFFCWAKPAIAQKTPHVSGDVIVSMKQGLISCKLYLSNLPDLKHQYEILLNRGMNIQFIKDNNGKVLPYSGWYNGKMRRDGHVYKLGIYADTIQLPPDFYIAYTGGFPVYSDTLNAFDFKGIIAFNGKTLRAAEQSLWYPVIYDKVRDRIIQDVTYSLDIKCDDCSSIYVNGSAPVASTHAQVTSSIPVSLMLFMGDYAIKKEKRLNFLNTNSNESELNIFTNNIESIQGFYDKKLAKSYSQKPTFLEHKPIKPMHPKAYWGFATYPTFAIAGLGFGNQIDTLSKKFRDTATYKFYAHEMAHYYFGSLLQASDNLYWFFTESIAEYLGLKATESFYGAKYREEYMRIPKNFFNNEKVIPLNKITDPEQISVFYRYTYAPFLLIGLEKISGEEKVFKTLQKMINTANPTTNYTFFKQCALEAGITESEWMKFEEEYINISSCKEIIDKLQG